MAEKAKPVERKRSVSPYDRKNGSTHSRSISPPLKRRRASSPGLKRRSLTPPRRRATDVPYKPPSSVRYSDDARSKISGNPSIVVKPLPPNIKYQELFDEFSRFGDIHNIDIKNGMKLSFAFVHFNSVESAMRAM